MRIESIRKLYKSSVGNLLTIDGSLYWASDSGHPSAKDWDRISQRVILLLDVYDGENNDWQASTMMRFRGRIIYIVAFFDGKVVKIRADHQDLKLVNSKMK